MSVSAEEFRLPSAGLTGAGRQPAALPRPGVHSTRLLAGFVPVEEAMQLLHARVPDPVPSTAELRTLVEARHRAVAERPAFRPVDPVLVADRTPLDAVAARPELHQAFEGQRWTVEWVDMRQVIAVQKEIITSGLDGRVQAAARNRAALLELCLPAEPETAEIAFNLDPDRRGMTLVSANSNLRLTGIGRQQGAIVIGFGLPAGFLNVGRHQGRYYLRNGYHRVAGLVRAGVTAFPAVVTDVDSYPDLARGEGIFPEEITRWTAPPLLGDFWDDAVALDSSRPVLKTGFHIRADEIRLPG